MTVRVYYSTDSGAPSLSGEAGKAIAVLDACLVTGYGAKAGAGWTKPHSGTNLAAYRQGTGGNGHYLYVDDTGTTSARVIGYESMASISDTSGAPFPTSAQFAGGLHVTKSNVASTTTRPWVIIATEKAFYFYVGESDTILSGAANSVRPLHFFGSFSSLKTGDAFNTALVAGIGATATGGGSYFGGISTTAALSIAGHYGVRSHTQTGGSVTLGKLTERLGPGDNIGGEGEAYPSPVTGGMMLAPVFLSESAISARRGKLPGLWAPLHSLPGACGDTFAGAGSMAGKSFILLNGAYGASYGARVAIEISDTW